MDYNERFLTLKTYIKQMSGSATKSLRWLTPQEIEQEIMLVLWHCHEKYSNFEEKHFKHTFFISVKNKLVDLSRQHNRRRILKFSSLTEEITKMQSDVPLHFYENGIEDIAHGLDLKERRRLDALVTFGKRGPQKETKKALYKNVKEILKNETGLLRAL